MFISKKSLVGVQRLICSPKDAPAERPRGLELDEEIEFRRLHHRQVDGLLALEDAIYYQPSLTIVLS